jgi:asparagine synthase (glutamine-hydrolysing)
MDIVPTTNSDCEVIIHLYGKYGMEQTLQMLDGVFAFVLIDKRRDCEEQLYVARDPLGVRPLYILESYDYNKYLYGFASDLSVIYPFLNKQEDTSIINHFEPGTFTLFKSNNFSITNLTTSPYKFIKNQRYFNMSFSIPECYTLKSNENNLDITNILLNIQSYFIKAIEKRCVTTERPIACLLSGGLDSSLVTSLVNDMNIKYFGKPVETYSIGLENSEDLKYAHIVADYLGTIHTEIIVTEEDFCKAIPEIIENIETYDITTVRASIGNYLLGKFIAKNSEAKVIFNGDGSDELCGGYLYMHKCPDPIEFDKETRRLLKDIHIFDVLRSDKSISSHGLEPRTPFLDRAWVQYYLSIPPKLRFHPGNSKCEKYLLRLAFSKEYYISPITGKPLLPDEIIWRTKEAFSDGVSSQNKSLFTIIQEHIHNDILQMHSSVIEEIIGDSENSNDSYPDLFNLKKLEKKFYKFIFNRFYKNVDIIPYFWMPKYINASDPSARTLSIYNNIINK